VSRVALWLGNAAPLRTIRWLDGALATAAKFDGATAIAAGDPTWLDLAADRATRVGIATAGVPTELQLDYLGWAQVVAAVVRQIGASTVLVDEASRPERFPEVAAIAELLDTAQLTHVVALVPDGAIVHASRLAGRELQTCRLHGPAVIGVRIPGAQIDEYPTPVPSTSMRRLDLPALALDPIVLGHRALPPRAAQAPRRTIERVADHLAVHAVAAAIAYANEQTALAANAPPSKRGELHATPPANSLASTPAIPRTPLHPTRDGTPPKGTRGSDPKKEP
jgi:electron transfer flavoprotein alpha/beta subunit